MQFEEILAELGNRLKIDIKADADGVCVIGVDDTMRVTLQNLQETGHVAVWAEIGQPPPQGLEKLYEAMLDANHLFRGTGGATISRNAETGTFFLCQCTPLSSLDGETFVVQIERFVNTLEIWQKLLADYRPIEAADDASEVPFGNSGFMAV